MSWDFRQPDGDLPPAVTKAAPTEECAWCRWPYPASQMTTTGGQRLCGGCHALYFGDDEEDEED